MTVAIEVAEVRDFTDVDAVVRETYAPFEDSFEWPAFWDYYLASCTDAAGRAPVCTLLVAREDDVVVGTGSYYPPGSDRYAEGITLPADVCGIRLVAVDPAHQHRGIGTALVEHCLDLGRADDAQTVLLHSLSAMTDAQRLYVQLGFVRAPDFDGHPDPTVEAVAPAYVYPLAPPAG